MSIIRIDIIWVDELCIFLLKTCYNMSRCTVHPSPQSALAFFGLWELHFTNKRGSYWALYLALVARQFPQSDSNDTHTWQELVNEQPSWSCSTTCVEGWLVGRRWKMMLGKRKQAFPFEISQKWTLFRGHVSFWRCTCFFCKCRGRFFIGGWFLSPVGLTCEEQKSNMRKHQLLGNLKLTYLVKG